MRYCCPTVSISYAIEESRASSTTSRDAAASLRHIGARAGGRRTRAVRRARWYLGPMSDRHLFDDLSERINQALRNSPAADIEKNLRALLADWFGRMDLVMRQDFDVQKKLLEQALARLATLEGRVAELERRANKVDPG
jgi:BMFP domain-containing protein YqiC